MPAIDTSKLPIGSIVNADGTVTKTNPNSTTNKDTFLKLLVAQLKYQDPTSPVDSSQFMAQSAQFSMLEQLQNMSTQTSSLVAAQHNATGASLLGHKIVASPATGTTDIVGLVTSVKMGSDGPILKIGDMEVPLSRVKEVGFP